ncbi:MAG: hypothetical protein NXI04_16820 [Planctomycetaceae bacterium]|nr:hypothetical protein [Planctomycetaceae bacterium]
MVPQRLILLLAIASWLAGIQTARSASLHPISHTDAWVRVTDRVDVRLNIFLDDVLRYEGLLQNDPDQLPRDSVAQAIENYDRRVVRQLLIFDAQGRPLRGELTARPTWRATADQVDLRANDLLKLTWKIRYLPTHDAELSLLTFEHQFTHPELPAPGELRLHVQHQATSRRLDAVVPPGRPHVLHLPADRSAVTGRDLNLMQVRMILTAGQVSVEFMAPAELMNAALPAEPSASVWSLDERQDFFRQWASENVSARLNGGVVKAGQITVEFPELSPERRADSATQSTGLTEPAHWRTRLVGIRIVYPRPGRIESFALAVQSWPVRFDDVVWERITPDGQTSSLISATPGEGPVFASEWFPDAVRPDSQSVGNMPQQWQLQYSEPNSWGRLTAGGLVAVWLLLLGLRWQSLTANLTSLVAVSVLLLATAGYSATRATYRVAAGDVRRYLQSALTQIYTSLQWNDDRAVVEVLSAFMEPDVTEQTFLSAIGSLAADSHEPVTTVLELQVVQVDVRPSPVPGRLQCDCQWHVSVMIDHWGHAHQRQLKLSGTLDLVRSADTWRIREFRPQTARFSESQADSADNISDLAGA